MSRRHVETITDFLIVAITPALIMFLVGSLVFFLTHVVYDGNFPGRLRFACALFVMAAVLIARISSEEGREHASLFAVPLAMVTILSVMKYTDATWFIVPLVAFVWWSTDKLTWDCTVLDDQQDVSGEGLLQTIGRQASADHREQDAEATTDIARADRRSLWQRWLSYRRRPHAPGVWVIYFGIAGLPIFGLGQLLLPVSERPIGFLLLCIFVASTLMLLMTTSFLQMRRYLQQRRLPFTDQMASVWLGTGGTLVVGLMLLALVLPRPHTGYSLLESFERVSSRDHSRASRLGFGDEGVVDEQQPGSGTAEKEAATNESSTGRQAASASTQSESVVAAMEHRRDGQVGKSQTPQTQSSSDARSPAPRSPAPQTNPRRETNASQQSQPAHGEPRSSPGRDAQVAAADSFRKPPTPSGPPSVSLSNPLQNVTFGKLATWIYLLLMSAIVAVILLRFGRDMGAALAAFFRELAFLLSRLLGRAERVNVASEPTGTSATTPARKPFSSFADPFAMGTTDQFTPPQLVHYTFEALQAWAYERDCERREEQTPLEFVAGISREHQQIGKLARHLAILYNQAAYAPGLLDSDSTKQLKSLWNALRRGST